MIGSALIERAADNENVCDVALGRASPASSAKGSTSKSAPAAAAVPQDIGKALGKLFGGR
ncbi:MAG: hypothetical protein DMF84_31540 [Acidobacteria bacterium]|nr:MAG: hypothetical protein DMF84_31540 [Acidobacteriota bacterium]